MKKFLAGILTIMLILGLVSCSATPAVETATSTSAAVSAEPTSAPTPGPTSAATPEPTPEPTPASSMPISNFPELIDLYVDSADNINDYITTSPSDAIISAALNLFEQNVPLDNMPHIWGYCAMDDTIYLIATLDVQIPSSTFVSSDDWSEAVDACNNLIDAWKSMYDPAKQIISAMGAQCHFGCILLDLNGKLCLCVKDGKVTKNIFA